MKGLKKCPTQSRISECRKNLNKEHVEVLQRTKMPYLLADGPSLNTAMVAKKEMLHRDGSGIPPERCRASWFSIRQLLP